MGWWHVIHRWALAEECCWFENFLPLLSHLLAAVPPPRRVIAYPLSTPSPLLLFFFSSILNPPECPRTYPQKGTLKTSSCRPKTYPAHSNGHAPLRALLPHPPARPQKEQLPKIHFLQVQTRDACSTISLLITAAW